MAERILGGGALALMGRLVALFGREMGASTVVSDTFCVDSSVGTDLFSNGDFSSSKHEFKQWIPFSDSSGDLDDKLASSGADSSVAIGVGDSIRSCEASNSSCEDFAMD
jgi:hypothetical protein